MSGDEIIADLLMLAHAAYALFALVGLMLILIGMVLGWRWTSNRALRVVHLFATLTLVVRFWAGMACPFSVVEDEYRSRVTTVCPLGVGFHATFQHCAFRGTK